MTVKDDAGKVILGHRSEGDSCSYDHRVKSHQFSPASFDNEEVGINETTWETIIQVGPNIFRFENVRIVPGERFPFS